MKQVVFASTLLVLLAGCASQPKNIAQSNFAKRAIASEAETEVCWQKARAAKGNLTQLAEARVQCPKVLSEYYDVKLAKSGSGPLYIVKFVNFENYLGDGYERIESQEVSIDEVKSYLRTVRRASPEDTLSLGSNGNLISSFGRYELVSPQGIRSELASVEAYLDQAGKSCVDLNPTNETSYCEEDSSISIYINWIYDNVIDYQYAIGMIGAKFDSAEPHVVRWNGQAVSELNSVLDIVPEREFVTALKSDWLIRNSNVYDKIATKTKLSEILAAMKRDEYGGRGFQSHSYRIANVNQRRQAINCALAYDNPRSGREQRGFACLQKHKITRFNYTITGEALKKYFNISRVTRDKVRVQIPVAGEAGATTLSFDVPLKRSGFVYYRDTYLATSEDTAFYAKRCRVTFPSSDYTRFIEAGQPPLLSAGAARCEAP